MKSWMAGVAILGSLTVWSVNEWPLGAVEPKPVKGQYFALARLLDEGERPLAGAVIRPIGVETGSTASWGATPPGFAAQVLSDTNGNIVLSRAQRFNRVRVQLEVPGVGSGEVWLEGGGALTEIHFGPFQTSMPVPFAGGAPGALARVPPRPLRTPNGVQPPIAPAPSFPPPTPAFTPGARLNWTNGPARPGTYSQRGSADYPPITVRLCPYPPGEAPPSARGVVQRLKLAGQVRTRTGEPLPAGLQVQARSGVESEHVQPDNEGRFAFDGLPAGQITLEVSPGMTMAQSFDSKPHWTGWRLAASNRSRGALLQGCELEGTLEQDKEDLLLVIERAEVPLDAAVSQWTPWRSEMKGFWGAETSGPPFIVLSGQVVDDRTGQPVKGVKLIPCRMEPLRSQPPPPLKTPLKKMVDAFTPKPTERRGRVFLDEADVQLSSNGTFVVEFIPVSYSPLLRVEAPGYVPLETEPAAQSTNNLVIRLTLGAGPAGSVLRPDGQPAVGATVVLVKGEGTISVHGVSPRTRTKNELAQVIGPEGTFTFEPLGGPGKVFALDPSGWAEEKVTGTDDVLKLRLKPWAAVKGTLVGTNGTPAAGLPLVVAWFEKRSDGSTVVEELGRTTSDTNGGFEFLHLPPRSLALQTIIGPPNLTLNPYRPYTEILPEPGVTNELGKVLSDPPPSPLEHWKKKLGL